jgi:hypothetical protein
MFATLSHMFPSVFGGSRLLFRAINGGSVEVSFGFLLVGNGSGRARQCYTVKKIKTSSNIFNALGS